MNSSDDTSVPEAKDNSDLAAGAGSAQGVEKKKATIAAKAPASTDTVIASSEWPTTPAGLSESAWGALSYELKHRVFPTPDLRVNEAAVKRIAELLKAPDVSSASLSVKSHGKRSEVVEIRLALEEDVRKLESEIARLSQKETLNTEEMSALKEKLGKLQASQEVSFLTGRIASEAFLLEYPELVKLFPLGKTTNAFVMSIDVRQSTELMLKARTPEEFARFITEVSQCLGEIVQRNLGVFDKFTGDGILAFFPIDFSGPDAGFRAVKAAEECHAAFKRVYEEHRRSFTAVLLDTGLGIGIDYGPVYLVSIAGDLTVVGTPVVYACRMGSSPAGKTYLNQPARDEIFDEFSQFCQFDEEVASFKGKGSYLAYRVSLNGKVHQPKEPDWKSRVKPRGAAATDETVCTDA